MPNLLIELFSEEIPARMQRRAAEDLKKLITNGMVDAGIDLCRCGRLFNTAPPDAGG